MTARVYVFKVVIVLQMIVFFIHYSLKRVEGISKDEMLNLSAFGVTLLVLSEVVFMACQPSAASSTYP